MRRIAFVMIAVLLYCPRLAAEDLVWLTDWNETFRNAKRDRKLVFVDLYADWCAPCRMMDQKVFVMPEVQDRLRPYVLLRVDVDHNTAGRRLKKKVLPTFIIYDPDERERFQFTGGMPAPHFLKHLDPISEAAPVMLHASDLLAEKKELEAWSQIAKAYTKMGAAALARDAWQHVERGSTSKGDAVAAQAASINGAFTWVLEGQGPKAVAQLKKIAETPATDETAALSWFTLGQVYVRMRDAKHAREAFNKSTTLVASDHPVARQAAAALAELQ